MRKYKIWMRLGAYISCTKDELVQLIECENNEVFKHIIDRGDFEFNGDSYIPNFEVSEALEQYDFFDKEENISEPTFDY